MRMLFRALLLASLLPLFLSCDPASDHTDFNDPAFLHFAGRLTPSGLIPETKAVTDKTVGSIVSIELTESGLYAIGIVADEKGTIDYHTGKYTAKDNTYDLFNLGTLSFNNSSSGHVTLLYTPLMGEVQQLPAEFLKPKATNNAFRTWNVEKTRVTVKGWTVVSADFKGCNLAEIAEFLRNNGNKAPEDVPNLSVTTISLTGTEMMILGYSDSTAELNEFSLNGNVLTYTWAERPGGFTFESDKAVIEYMDGKCLLTIDGRIRNSTTSGTVSFVLSPID